MRHNDSPLRKRGRGHGHEKRRGKSRSQDTGSNAPRPGVSDPSTSTDYLNFSQLSLESQPGNGTLTPPMHPESATYLPEPESAGQLSSSTEATMTRNGGTAAPSSQDQRGPPPPGRISYADKVKKK
ncbi:hypothetical protein C8Q80DRAFT_476139 [Daedaleopsis nitida]|nr:hypothetical protein C8Q80DRAFT_476139 [Daedaleopsis nitida]